jgi:NDP-sugar pyrophosphorylase family protein
VRQVLDALGERFLVVYGDNLVELDLEGLVAAHLRRRADVSIAVFDALTPNTGMVGGRVVLDDGDRVVSFAEGVEEDTAARHVNAGVYVVEKRVLADLPVGRFFDWGRDIFPALLARGARVHGYPIEGYCLGLDTPGKYERGLALINSGQVKLR